MRFLMASWVLLAALLAAFAPSGFARAQSEDALAGTEWQMTTLEQTDAVAGSTVTLTFGTDGTVSGSSGCNTYGSKYTLDGSSLTFDTVFSTRRACEDQVAMAQEAAYLRVLEDTRSYESSADLLTLTTSDGQQVVFAPPAVVEAASAAGEELNYDEITQSRAEDGGFVLGNPDAVLTVVEFADFTCPHCQDYHEDIRHFIREYVATGKAKFEYRMIRATGNPNGDLAAQLAECAETLRPGSFWKAQDKIFALSGAGLYDTLTAEVAGLIEVKADDLTACTETATQLQIDSQVAVNAGVTGTPAIMVRINGGDLQWISVSGELLNAGGIPFDYLAQLVEYVLANP
jgi:heat shock protein HslJ/predicted DsbA family dithiol-disulfide isomerase